MPSRILIVDDDAMVLEARSGRIPIVDYVSLDPCRGEQGIAPEAHVCLWQSWFQHLMTERSAQSRRG